MNKRRKDSNGRVLTQGESQRKDKTYTYRWTSADGKRHQIYARTLDELRKKEVVIQKEIYAGVSRNSITLNEQIEMYLKTKVTLAASTLSNYTYYFHHTIENSRLGRMKIRDIKKSDVLLFYRDLKQREFSNGTIRIIHKIIHPALQLACDDDALIKNPSDGCAKDYTEEVERKYALTLEEEQEFLERLDTCPRMKSYYPFFAILLYTGIRISEAIGLTWNDIDMEERTININHQVQYRAIDGKMKFFATPTKTSAGMRSILMSDEVYALFKEQRKIWLRIKKDSDFEVDGYKDFVFISHTTGRCMHHTSVRKILKRVVEVNDKREIKLPNISPHILRHTRCCRWAESGCDIKVLQYLMGHNDIRITMRVYNHVDKSRVKRQMDKMESLHQFTSVHMPICNENG